MKKLIIEQSDREFYTAHSGLSLVGLCVNKHTELCKKLSKHDNGKEKITSAEVIKSYLGLLCTGKSDYEAVENMRGDDYFKVALGIKNVPSAARLRQRFDKQASNFERVISEYLVDPISDIGAPITPLDTGHVPLDVDVFTLDNSKTKKEGVSRTYQGFDGYSPIAGYLGQEGWCVGIELRKGSQHSQENFIPFLKKAIDNSRKLTTRPLLVRLDSAHDSIDTLVTLRESKKVSFIVKWNPRRSDVQEWKEKAFKEGRVVKPRVGKKVAYLSVRKRRFYNGKAHFFTLVIRVTERTITSGGQIMLFPDVELEGWWTSLELPEEQVIELYKGHAVCEQYHSEFKTDLDIERLPSGKFATNALILSLGAFAYIILRIIGQFGLMGWESPVRHKAKRRRIKMVIQELMHLAARLIKTAHRLKLRFSRHCPGYRAFEALYYRLLPT